MSSKYAVFSFQKPSPNTTIASTKIAQYIAGRLKVPLIWGESIAEEEPEVLFIVGGMFAYCKALPQLAKCVLAAEQIVWIQNDYTINPPMFDGEAQSPFRRAFVEREEMGLPRTHYWTTVKKNADKTPCSAYVNWNMLGASPVSDREFEERNRKRNNKVLYYGAYRIGRVRKFREVFNMLAQAQIPLEVSSTSLNFRELAEVVGPMPNDEFSEIVGSYGAGLYLEDAKSSREFHSPATRFYEMLTAGLPMMFQVESAITLMEAEISVSPEWVLTRPSVAKRFMENRREIAKNQRWLWNSNFSEELDMQFRKAMRKIK